MNKIISKGDFVTVDIGAIVNFYRSDITRTFIVGKATDKHKKIYETVKLAHQKAYEAIKFLTKIYGEKLSLDNLLPVDYSMIDECIRKSDLVFESVSEDMTTKKDILKSVSLYLPPEACLCTGTS